MDVNQLPVSAQWYWQYVLQKLSQQAPEPLLPDLKRVGNMTLKGLFVGTHENSPTAGDYNIFISSKMSDWNIKICGLQL